MKQSPPSCAFPQTALAPFAGEGSEATELTVRKRIVQGRESDESILCRQQTRWHRFLKVSGPWRSSAA
jgi:hypothetical protein